MKISRKTWHYQVIQNGVLWHSGWNNHSNSLCLYFWQVMWCLFTPIGTALLAFSIPYSLILLAIQQEPTGGFVLYAGIGLTAIFIGCAAILLIAVDYISEKRKAAKRKKILAKHGSYSAYHIYERQKEKQKAEQKQPSLFLSWLRAKKDKVCPIIEVVK